MTSGCSWRSAAATFEDEECELKREGNAILQMRARRSSMADGHHRPKPNSSVSLSFALWFPQIRCLEITG
ncbi:hypothetical protein ACFX13_001168 [Malus domestica]